VIVEATGVRHDGLLTPWCLGLWDDAQIEGHKRLVAGISQNGTIPGIQLNHSGWKGSRDKIWRGYGPLPPS